jgi:methylated-DNA-[protein]-cysteine S-methyltransferase
MKKMSDLKELKRLGTGAEEASLIAAARFADQAVGQGATDVAYAFADSPFGRLLVALTKRGLVTLAYPNEDPDDTLARLADEISPRILESARATDEVRRQLGDYFERRRRRFDIPVDLRLTRGFGQRILRQTTRIPYGAVATYRDVATRAGSPLAVRAAGNALGSNPVPIVVPCHRVVRTGGGLGGYTGGLDRKVTLLRLEGALEPSGEGHSARAGRMPMGRRITPSSGHG